MKVLQNTFAASIVALVALMMTVSFASAAPFTYTSGIIKVGSRGAHVSDLQTCMNGLNFSTGVVDGVFGNNTKAGVMAFQASKGLVADGVIGMATGPAFQAACAGTTTTTTTTTSTTSSFSTTGDAGDLTTTTTSTDVESDVKEGDSENVLGLKVEADDSDIAITSVKVVFEKSSGTGSTRFDKYVDEVMVMLDGEEVASVDADEFSKDGSEYSKSISLEDAVVAEDDKVNLYVAVKTLSTVDDTAALFDVKATQIRYIDESGMSISDTLSHTETFGFGDQGEDDKLSIKSSSDNPIASTLKVEDNNDSDEYMVLAFRLEADEDGSDIMLNELPVAFTISNNGGDIDSVTAGTQTTANIEDIIDQVMVDIDGEKFEADLDGTGNLTLGVGSATFTVDFDEDDVVIEAGDIVDVEVYVTFKEQDGNYNNAAKISAQVTASSIDAEGDDTLSGGSLSGTASGKTHTLDIAGAVVDNFGWSVNSTGAFIDFTFDVESEDEDFVVNIADIIANDTITGNATVAAPVLSVTGGDADENTPGAIYTVLAGDDATFQVRYALTTGTNGQFAQVKITSAAGQEVENSKQTSPTAVVNLQ